jgi:hypothetical protein
MMEWNSHTGLTTKWRARALYSMYISITVNQPASRRATSSSRPALWDSSVVHSRLLLLEEPARLRPSEFCTSRFLSFFLSFFPSLDCNDQNQASVKKVGPATVYVGERLVLRKKKKPGERSILRCAHVSTLFSEKRGDTKSPGWIVTTPRFTHPISVDFCRRKERNGWE